MKFFFSKNTLILFLISLICTLAFYTLICLPGISTTFSDTHGLERLFAIPNTELLAGQKIQGSFYSHFSHLGIVSLRFTNFGKINTDIVIFRIKERNAKSWIYENTYKVDQFQPNDFFTFGFPIQPNSAKKQYFFEVESLSGQKGNAIGLSTYKPVFRLTYAFSKSDLFSHPIYLTEIMQYQMVQKISQESVKLLLLGIYIVIFFTLLCLKNIKYVKKYSNKNKNLFLHVLHFVKRHPVPFIIIFGLSLRLLLASGPFGGDTNAFMQESMYMQHHIFNVYAHSNEHGYNYSPVMFFVFTLTEGFTIITHLPWPFLWRALLSLFDLGTVLILIQIAKIKKISPVRTAILFFLNPISIFISGSHGQFENVAIFFLLLAVLLHYKTFNKKNQKRILKWIYVTVGILVKHVIVYQLPVFWRAEVKEKKKIASLFLLSIIVFLMSFIPYWSGAKKLIIDNVFLYGGASGFYGITSFLSPWVSDANIIGGGIIKIYKYLFILSLFIIPIFLKGKDVARNILLMFLFFLTFTSGFGAQYFVLPIAFGSLFPTKWFYLYSIIIGIFVAILELQLIPYQTLQISFFSWNAMWIFVALWFLSEAFYFSKTLRRLYQSLFFTSIFS